MIKPRSFYDLGFFYFMKSNLYLILGVLWSLVCRKDYQIQSSEQWQQELDALKHHPLALDYSPMQVSDAQFFMKYLDKQLNQNKSNIIDLHAFETYQAISILNPEAWEKFFQEKQHNNQTYCNTKP